MLACARKPGVEPPTTIVKPSEMNRLSYWSANHKAAMLCVIMKATYMLLFSSLAVTASPGALTSCSWECCDASCAGVASAIMTKPIVLWRFVLTRGASWGRWSECIPQSLRCSCSFFSSYRAQHHETVNFERHELEEFSVGLAE